MMKKIFLALLVAATCSTSVSAQKGMSGFGVNIPFSVGSTSITDYGGSKRSLTSTSFGIGVKYYYNISNYFRVEPSAEYIHNLAYNSGGEKDYDYPTFKAFLNGHVFFASPRPARPYFIAGMGYVFYEQLVYYGSHHDSKNDDGFNYNIGLGLDIRLSHSLSMQVEATGMSCLICSNDYNGSYEYRNHKGRWLFIARVGLAYNF